MKTAIASIQNFIRTSAVLLIAATSLLALQPAIAAGVSDSSVNWSGYVATGGTFTGVSGTWVVPTVTNASQLTADATWVGIGGVTGNDLIQAGTQEITGQGSTTEYEAWVETLPNASQPIASFTVNPGNSISVSIKQQSADTWLTTISNNSTGQSYSTITTYTSTLSSAEWIEEAPMSGNSLVPLDNFGTIQFSNANAIENGSTVNLSQSGATPMSMLNVFGQTLATPSAIGSNGSSFSVTKSATATNIPSPSTRTFSPSGRHGIQGFGHHGYGYTTGSTGTTTTTTTDPSTSIQQQNPFGGFGFPFTSFNGFGSGAFEQMIAKMEQQEQQQIQALENQMQSQPTTTVTVPASTETIVTPTDASGDSGWKQVYSKHIPGFGSYTVYVSN